MHLLFVYVCAHARTHARCRLDTDVHGDGRVTAVCFTADGAHVVTASWDSLVKRTAVQDVLDTADALDIGRAAPLSGSQSNALQFLLQAKADGCLVQ